MPTFLTDADKLAIVEARIRHLEAERFQHELNAAMAAEIAKSNDETQQKDAADTIAYSEASIATIDTALVAAAATYATLAAE